LGTIEEWFVTKLQPGEVFVFAGKKLELYKIKNMEVLVKKANTSKPAKHAAWMGGKLALSAQMSHLLRAELYLAGSKQTSAEMQALEPLFIQQRRASIVPHPNQFLIESFKTREGFHLIFYPFEGHYVHQALAGLLAYRISLLRPQSFSLACNDYGFELLSDQEIKAEEIIDNQLFSTKFVHQDLWQSINATELAQRRFRDIAVISGLLFTGYPGKTIKTKHVQGSSRLLFEVFKEHEPDNLLLMQAFRETFEHQLEEGRLIQVLERIQQQDIVVKYCKKPTPFSFPIITDRLREKLSSETLAARIQKMTAQYLKD
jgi:ATP-dependent Lhr-like helicase